MAWDNRLVLSWGMNVVLKETVDGNADQGRSHFRLYAGLTVIFGLVCLCMGLKHVFVGSIGGSILVW